MRANAAACDRQRSHATAQAGHEAVNFKLIGAIFKKDVQSLYLLVLLTTLLFAGDVFLTRLELLPMWASFRQPLLMLSCAVLIFAVFQLDSPVSLVDDWLCR